MLSSSSPVKRDPREHALKCCLETSNIGLARELIETRMAEDSETPHILPKKASVLGLLAQYEEAHDILLRLSRDFPGRPAILRRLVIVFEQLRHNGKDVPSLKAYT
jgi:eukaryotic-like serine/threonine-protein kinase